MVVVGPIPAAVRLPGYIIGSRHLDGAVLIAIGMLIWVGWGIVVMRHWPNIISSTTRLGYVAGDCALLAPGCITSGIGLLTDQSWGPPTLLIAVGAAAFDLTHTFIFTAEIGYPKIKGKAPPAWAYVVVILFTLTLLGWIGWREIWFETGSHPPWFLWALSAAASLLLSAIVLVGVQAARKLAQKLGVTDLKKTPLGL
jgi:hypothetical protein